MKILVLILVVVTVLLGVETLRALSIDTQSNIESILKGN